MHSPIWLMTQFYIFIIMKIAIGMDIRSLRKDRYLERKMGMYDSFWGKYICPRCKKQVDFEEQTKDYGRDLNDFMLGDYIDKANKDYFYNFTYECPHCNKETDLSIGVRKGQYVGVYFASDTEKMDPKELENIEEGYQRKREYEEMCSRKLGYEETEEWAEKLIALKVGDRLFALQTEWEVLEVYLEELKPEIEEKEFMRILYHPTVVYRCRANNEDV